MEQHASVNSPDENDILFMTEMPTVEKVNRLVTGYMGTVHGDDESGAIDVEFPTVVYASSFAQTVHDAFGWRVDIREGDTITSLYGTTVLTVRSAA